MSLRASLIAIALLAGCTDERPPSQPGDGDGTGTVGDGDGDGDGDGGDASIDFAISGVVCIISDLRLPEQCDAGDASGLTVRDRNSNASATTSATGAFTLPLASASSATIEVTGTGVHASIVPLALGPTGASNVLFPVPNADAWADLVLTTIGAEPDGSGAIAAYLLEGNDPAVGAEVFSPAGATIAPYYDDGGALQWTQNGFAGVAGAALMFGVPSSDDATFTALNDTASVVQMVTVPIVEDATTFVFVDLTE